MRRAFWAARMPEVEQPGHGRLHGEAPNETFAAMRASGTASGETTPQPLKRTIGACAGHGQGPRQSRGQSLGRDRVLHARRARARPATRPGFRLIFMITIWETTVQCRWSLQGPQSPQGPPDPQDPGCTVTPDGPMMRSGWTITSLAHPPARACHGRSTNGRWLRFVCSRGRSPRPRRAFGYARRAFGNARADKLAIAA